MGGRMAAKQLIKSLAILSLFPQFSYGADKIIGGVVGYHYAELSTFSALPSNVNDIQLGGINYQLRNGVAFDQASRLYGTYSFSSDDLSHHQGVLVSYDWLFPFDNAGLVSLFVGASAGLSSQETQYTDSEQSYFDTRSSYVFGGQTGVVFELSDQFTSEVGFRYLMHNFTSSGDNVSSLSVNDAEQVYLGIDYMF